MKEWVFYALNFYIFLSTIELGLRGAGEWQSSVIPTAHVLPYRCYCYPNSNYNKKGMIIIVFLSKNKLRIHSTSPFLQKN
jgi:hypothetical protein